MIDAIRYNMANLMNFSGRDSRSTFWFYVLFLAIIQIGISFALSIVMAGGMMADAFHSARIGIDGAAMQQHMIARMADVVRMSMWVSALVSLIMTALLAASFTRRVHDSGKSGWIAAVTVAIQLLSILLTIGMIDDMVHFIGTMKPEDPAAMQAAMRAQQAKFALKGMLGWVPILGLVIFGVWPSSDGENRYGPEPDHI